MKAFPPVRRGARQSVAHVFALPLMLFVASVAGLVLGLTGEGLPDIAAWALLSLPLVAVAVAWRRRGRTSPQRKT